MKEQDRLYVLHCARWSLEKMLETEEKIRLGESVPLKHIHQVTNNIKAIIELAGGERFDTSVEDRRPASSAGPARQHE